MVRILGMNILYKQIEQTIRSRASHMSVQRGAGTLAKREREEPTS